MAELLCFGPAGTGTTDFHEWQDCVVPSTTVRAVRIPGRETLLSTPAHREMPALIAWILRDIAMPTGRFALYGHSMGAWVAYELVHALRKAGRPGPTHLYVGARRAPDLPDRHGALSGLDDDDFIAAVQERYQAIPERLLKSPGILRIFLPTLRADFALLDSYRHIDRPPLDLPITAFRGLGDPTVSRDEVSAWRGHTTGDFRLVQVPGGHFFHREELDLVASAVRV